jgi:hypothetical protein
VADDHTGHDHDDGKVCQWFRDPKDAALLKLTKVWAPS